jgi:hypothetical protein
MKAYSHKVFGASIYRAPAFSAPAFGPALPALFLILILSSCGLINLEPVTVEFSVVEGEVLDSRETELRLTFPAHPDEASARAALSVRSARGAADGDISLEENDLVFTPKKPWNPAERYEVGLSGKLRLDDGREAELELSRSFYALRTGPGPRLLSHTPADGENLETGGSILLEFSEAMDRSSVEGALSLSPGVECRYEWDDEGTRLSVFPRQSLSALTLYTLDFSGEMRALDGALSEEPEPFSFGTFLDRERPRVLRTLPAEWEGGTAEGWHTLANAPGINGLRSGQAIWLEFSKPVLERSLREAFSMNPEVEGNLDFFDQTHAVFAPSEAFTPGASYRLSVSGELSDLKGIKSAEPFDESFSVGDEFLRLLEFKPDPAQGETRTIPQTFAEGQAPDVFDVYLAAGLGDELGFTLVFSKPFRDMEAKLRAYRAIDLSRYFPAGLGPSLRTVSFPDDSSISFVFSGMELSSSGEETFYSLGIAGGEGGLSDSAGEFAARLESDLRFYLRLHADEP